MIDPAAEERLRTLVHTFYSRVQEDALLGPVFDAHIDDWEPHLQKMCDFWSSILYATGRFSGDPIGAHRRVPGIASEHFDRWLDLFGETAQEVLPEHEAIDIVGRSRRMRLVLERAIPDPDPIPT